MATTAAGPRSRLRLPEAPAWLALVAGFAALGASIGARPLSDNSFLTHLATGRLILDGGIPSRDPYTFTAGGEDWVVQSWLASALYGVVDEIGGGYGLLALNAFLVAALAAAVVALTRSTDSLVARLALAGLALGVGAGAWAERPLLIGLLALAATLVVLDRRLVHWWLVPVFAVWVNAHGSFPLGVVLILAVAAGERLDGGSARHELRAAAAAAAGAVGGALLALQPRLLLFPLELLSRSDVLRGVVEWRSPTFEPGWQRLWLLQVVIAVLLLVRRPRWRTAIPLVLFGAASLVAARNIAVASLVLLPGMAAATKGLGSLRSGGRSVSASVVVAAALAATVILAAVAGSEEPFDYSEYPVRQLSLVTQGDRRVAAPDFAGNLLEAAQGEEATVFYDDRFDLFAEEVSLDYRRLLAGGPGWDRVLERHGIETVVWDRREPLSALLAASPGWQVRYADADWITAVRRDGG